MQMLLHSSIFMMWHVYIEKHRKFRNGASDIAETRILGTIGERRTALTVVCQLIYSCSKPPPPPPPPS